MYVIKTDTLMVTTEKLIGVLWLMITVLPIESNDAAKDAMSGLHFSQAHIFSESVLLNLTRGTEPHELDQGIQRTLCDSS